MVELKEALLRLIPEFDLIEDRELREKILHVWESALKSGGWRLDNLKKMPFTLLIPDCKITFVEHVRSVVRMCMAVEKEFEDIYGERLKINKDYLLAGALLHDIGKLVEYKEENGKFVKSSSGKLLRHPFSGVGLCYDQGIPDEILHIIATHSKEGDLVKRTPEAIILHHVDFMNYEPFKEW